MYVPPTRSGLLDTLLTAGPRLEQHYQSGEFDELLQRLLGDFSRASAATMDKIWALRRLQHVTEARWRNGQFGIHAQDVATDRDKLLKAFTEAASGLFTDYGIDATRPIHLTVGDDEQIQIGSQHPDKLLIEDLISSSGLLKASIIKLMADTHLVEAAKLKSAALPAEVQALRQNLTLELGIGDDGRVGEIILAGRVVASSEQDDLSNKLSAMDFAIRQFDRADQLHRQMQAAELAQLKRSDERRRTNDEIKRERDLAERLAEKEAAERLTRLHPELGHRPVFI